MTTSLLALTSNKIHLGIQTYSVVTCNMISTHVQLESAV